jgi:ABC-type bacteriocin/lantibiotic exporter with double-glycine peptidase domain
LVRNHPTPSNQENLIELQSKRSQQIFKNRLFLTSLLNLLIFLTFIVSMAYYKWALISLPVY